MSRIGAAAVGLLVLFTLAGCGRPPAPVADWGSAPPSAEKIGQAIRARSDSISTLRAGMEIIFADTQSGESESCRGSLSYLSPDLIRLRGTSASFFTVFELIADPRSVWLDIPREEVLIFGSRDDPSWNDLPLSPDVLLTALLVDPCPGEPCLAGSTALVEEGAEFLLEGKDWVLTVSRETGLPVRYQGPPERPFEIIWREWGLRGGMAWPHEIEIHPRRGDGETLKVGLGRVLLGRKISEKLFEFEPEESREILSPHEAGEWWRQRVP